MTSQVQTSELIKAKLLMRSTASLGRFLSMAEVLHDAIRPWLKGGRAKDIIGSSESDAEAISAISANLLIQLGAAEMLLKAKLDTLHKYEFLCRNVKQTFGKSDDTSQDRLSLVADSARKTADHIRPMWGSPTNWIASQGLDDDEEHLDYVLRSLDYARWQILKEFAKLVAIFDDHDDPASDEPCEAWRRDQAAMDNE